jgi:hypothetical protein
VGPLLHVAVSVTFVFTVAVRLVAVTVQTGGEVAGAIQFTLTDAGGLLPAALVATSEYVLDPATEPASVHDDVVELQLVHV